MEATDRQVRHTKKIKKEYKKDDDQVYAGKPTKQVWSNTDKPFYKY